MPLGSSGSGDPGLSPRQDGRAQIPFQPLGGNGRQLHGRLRGRRRPLLGGNGGYGGYGGYGGQLHGRGHGAGRGLGARRGHGKLLWAAAAAVSACRSAQQPGDSHQRGVVLHGKAEGRLLQQHQRRGHRSLPAGLSVAQCCCCCRC